MKTMFMNGKKYFLNDVKKEQGTGYTHVSKNHETGAYEPDGLVSVPITVYEWKEAGTGETLCQRVYEEDEEIMGVLVGK